MNAIIRLCLACMERILDPQGMFYHPKTGHTSNWPSDYAQLLNTFLFLWYTAANLFIFSLAFNIDPQVPRRYGYGLGKETYLTPSPWIFGVLFIIHVLFAGTILYTQWTEKGNEIVIEELGL